MGLMPPQQPHPLPDPKRVAACRAEPEAGPRIVFFCGGTALRATSTRLVGRTHNSAHFLTPFDSGGSSAQLRRHLGMPSVGDIRNRLVAMADLGRPGVRAVHRLLSHRLPREGAATELQGELAALAEGRHPLQEPVPGPVAVMVAELLAEFAAACPPEFDLRGASLGNLVLAGGYVANGGDLDRVIDRFAATIGVRGLVRPVSPGVAHLRAHLEDGREVSGQHLLTGKEVPALGCRIRSIGLVDRLPDGASVQAAAHPAVAEEVARADLVCLPMGSFWTSLMASLLPAGVGRAVAAARGPKVFIPSTGRDPELEGMTIADCVRALQERVAVDGGAPRDALHGVLVDTARGDYRGRLDPPAVAACGVDVWDVPLVRGPGSSRLDPEMLADVLVSLAR